MMLFGLRGLGQTASDPTSMFTDSTGVACRLYETTQDAYGDSYCDPCKMGEDGSGNPVACPDGTTMIPSTSAPTATLLPSSIPVPSTVAPVAMPTALSPVIAPVAPQSAGYQQQMIGYDANGNPIYASCNGAGQCFDANGNPIQPSMTASAESWMSTTFGPNWALYVVGGLAAAALMFGAVVIFRR